METKKEILQIHHIAKRLPYGLKMETSIINIDTNKITIQVLNGFQIGQLLFELKKGEWFTELFNTTKPILFPLSCLTQEITIKGETFTPIKRFREFSDHKVKFESPDCIILKDTYSIEQDVLGAPLAIIEKLHEWHIDYENLIEKGLAISVFDLTENPYT